jgi:hypothetical protein
MKAQSTVKNKFKDLIQMILSRMLSYEAILKDILHSVIGETCWDRKSIIDALDKVHNCLLGFDSAVGEEEAYSILFKLDKEIKCPMVRVKLILR